MSTSLRTLTETLPPWLDNTGEEADVVVASFCRLVRNLPGQPFPGWSTAESRRAVADKLLPLLLSRPGLKSAFSAEMTHLSLFDRHLLLEEHLISPCMAARQDGCHAVIPRKKDMTIMINEEEHLVVNFFRGGLQLSEVLADARRLAASLEKQIAFAHDEAHGYLSSLPSEAGDGIQLYAVLHLPALAHSEEMLDQVTSGLSELGIGFEPFFLGMKKETGNVFEISTTPAPKGGSDEAAERLRKVVDTLVMRERQVRAKLRAVNQFDVGDRVARACGLFHFAIKISYREMLDAISCLRFGTDCHFVTWKAPREEALSALAHLCIDMAPAHLGMRMNRRDLQDSYLPLIRATNVRTLLAQAGARFKPSFKLNDTHE